MRTKVVITKNELSHMVRTRELKELVLTPQEVLAIGQYIHSRVQATLRQPEISEIVLRESDEIITPRLGMDLQLSMNIRHEEDRDLLARLDGWMLVTCLLCFPGSVRERLGLSADRFRFRHRTTASTR